MPAQPTVDVKPYGHLPTGEPAHLITLTHPSGLSAAITEYGATLTSLRTSDQHGQVADVTLGYDTLEGYLNDTTFMGSTVGRVANRIAQGSFTLEGKTYQLVINNGPNHLHGGLENFARRLWNITDTQADNSTSSVTFTRTSPDGEEGYPGTLDVTVTYTLSHDALTLTMQAETDVPTPVNLCNHAYWNLSGDRTTDVLDHQLTLHASRYLPIDDTSIPYPDPPAPVAHTPFDFTFPHTLGERIDADHEQLKHGNGYDHCFVVDGEPDKLRPFLTLQDPASGRVMHIEADQPGVQVYTANFLDTTGRNGQPYPPRSAVALETQQFPNAVNRPADAASVICRPGTTYRHTVVHRFATLAS